GAATWSATGSSTPAGSGFRERALVADAEAPRLPASSAVGTSGGGIVRWASFTAPASNRPPRYSRARDHGSHPQLLHHRPYRPRQVDARRPPDPALRGSRGPGLPRPDPRLHGPRTGARDHDQGEHRHAAVHRQGREDVRAQPDRYAGPRRFLPRGAPVADELRGRAPRRRRLAGRRGADGREPI